MKIISDLHLHSRFSRATSKSINIENLEKYANLKGLNLLGTGDLTHPEWIKELKKELTEDGSGILKSKTGFNFVLQGEVSNIYTQDGKGRRIHNVILAKSFDVVDQIQETLLKKGRLDYDGRPIFGFSCIELVEMLKNIDEKIEIIPAHAWTPWFSLFGSMSGFNSIEECYKDQTKHIYALETGLSSDPSMNWRLSQLDKYTLISNSDSHSFWPWRIGREANIFDMELTYDNLINAIRKRKGFVETIEVDPNYGKYHLDGHRACNICMEPKEALKNKNICPKCKRNLTIGVLHRIEELADREEGFKPKNAVPFKSLIPLSEILAELLGSNVATQKIWKEYYNLINNFESEFDVLLEAKKEDLIKYTDEKIADAIILNREGKIKIKPGFDGVYGQPLFSKNVTDKKETKSAKIQKSLSEF
ncbi:DNA helicase UvrD [Candidatus Woesearchaeota archaeon]|nr:DNA helicase UvrD [Candidatus Woesearchaeota archaeon]|tara:strand:+ start:10631 stop:11887 length:1257 start_codon:yes stop_codon:yes gene_type:complete